MAIQEKRIVKEVRKIRTGRYSTVSSAYNDVIIFRHLCVCLKQRDFETDFSAVIITKSFALHRCVTVACGELRGSLQCLRFHSPGRCSSGRS